MGGCLMWGLLAYAVVTLTLRVAGLVLAARQGYNLFEVVATIGPPWEARE